MLPLWAWAALALASAPALQSRLLAAQDRHPRNPLDDLVAVGYTRGEILLAAVTDPSRKLEWRLRRIPITPAQTLSAVTLASSGTKLLVAFADGPPLVLDLTQRITSIGEGPPAAPQHRLPQQRFAYASHGSVCLLNDLGQQVRPGACRKAEAAVANDDGRTLYALPGGSLIVVEPDGAREQKLPYTLPPGSTYRLVSGAAGAARGFLVLVTEPSSSASLPVPGGVTKIVDPYTSATLGQFRNPTVAALRAQLDLAPNQRSQAAPEADVRPSDAALETLVAHLDADALPAHPLWSFYHVAVTPELYAPVLEFARDEPIYPSNFEIWQDIRPRAQGSSFGAYEKAYASLGDRRWASCGAYVRTLSYPGTWLEEYWYYYPFDEGHPHAHFHDSEHMFIEIDKLGGTVRNVFASDHDSFVPNNLYSTLAPGARPVALPLYALVESGKHAMAPDLNHDGRFTRGVDDNLHLESYSFWGLRDRTSGFHFLMEPYRSSMSEPRYRQDRFALQDETAFFPAADVLPEHQVCRLRAFPEDDPSCPDCGVATAEAAAAHLVEHRDAREPENIYKPYVVPWREVRVGMDLYDWLGDRRAFAFSYVGDLRHLTAGLVRVPLRLGLDSMWNPFPQPVELPGPLRVARASSSVFAGAHLERLVTSTQGFYAGATVKWSDIVPPAPSLVHHWVYGGVAYRAGYILELPSPHWGSLVNQVGVVLQEPPYPVLFEWRISWAFLRQRGRTSFGARPSDRNPYER